MSNQAKIEADQYSSKYYAERVLDVYKKAIREKKQKKTLLEKTKDAIKGLKD